MTTVERELFAALERLKESNPSNPDLVKKAKLGKLRINATTVAKEAGRARTLIGYDGCAYPRVRAAIKEMVDPAGVPTSFEDVNRKLRQENYELRQTVRIAQAQLAAMIRRMDQLDTEAERKIKQAKRQAEATFCKADCNQVAGTRLIKT
jgi:hypothetical protein